MVLFSSTMKPQHTQVQFFFKAATANNRIGVAALRWNVGVFSVLSVSCIFYMLNISNGSVSINDLSKDGFDAYKSMRRQRQMA